MPRIIQKPVKGGQWFEYHDDNELSGFGVAQLSDDKTLILESIHVIPGRRKRGIGSRLLESIINWGKDQGAQKLEGEFKPEYGRGSESEKAAKSFYNKNEISIDEKDHLSRRL